MMTAVANGKTRRKKTTSTDAAEPAAESTPRRTLRDYGGSVLSRVSLRAITRHPANRRPAEADVAALAESLEREGMLEPIVVRPLPAGDLRAEDGLRWELVSGETRVLAARWLGWAEVDAHVVHCDDARALELLAVYNAQRRDLTPIDKAKLIQRLCQPVEQGGAGLTRQAAAQIYRLESHAAASNLVRLLELPAAWQDRVARGELPQSCARELLPIAKAERLLAVMDEAWSEREHDRGDSPFATREQLRDYVQETIENRTRPVDDTPHAYDWSHSRGDQRLEQPTPRLFDLTPQRREVLGVVELHFEGAKRLVATNAEAWDELQLPLLKERVQDTERAGSDVPAGRRQRTAAQDKALHREQDEQLQRRIDRWRLAWLREIVARKLRELPVDHWVLRKLVLWCLAQHWSFHEHNQLAIADILAELTGGSKRLREEPGTGTPVESLDATHCTDSVLQTLLTTALTLPERNPEYPVWRAALVEALARDLRVDVAAEWLLLQSSGTWQLPAVEFFGLHNSRQLDALGDELGVWLSAATSKAAKLRVLDGVERILALPKSIEPLVLSVGKKPKRKAAH